MERNVSRFLQFWMRGRQREKREGKVLSRRSHAAFHTFLPRSETLTGGDKHIWGIGQNCKIGPGMIVARPEKIFATRNSAITSPFLPKLPPTLSLLKKQSFKILKYETTIYCSFPSKHLQSIFVPKEKLKGHDFLGLQSVGTFSPEKLEMHISHLSRPLSAFIFELSRPNANCPNSGRFISDQLFHFDV